MLFIDYREYRKDRVEIKFNYVIYGSLRGVDISDVLTSLNSPIMLLTYPDDEVVLIVSYEKCPLFECLQSSFPNKIFLEISDKVLNLHYSEYLAGVQEMTRVSFFLEKRLDIQEIIPNLFLSGMNHADDNVTHASYGIKSIVNVTDVTDSVPNTFEDDPTYTYMKLKIRDSPNENIYKCFDICSDFISREIEKGKSVLVHCVAGISRSATLVMAHIMKTRKLTVSKAYWIVKNKRWVIEPNMGFYNQLLEYEQDIFKQKE
jgi:protein-tyrosine phosphatase